MDQHHLIFVSFIIHALLTMTMVINQRCWQATVPVQIYHAVSFLNIDPPYKPFTNRRPTNHAFRFRGTVRLRVDVTVRVMAVKLANLFAICSLLSLFSALVDTTLDDS